MKSNPIRDRAFEFSLQTIKLYLPLVEGKEYILSRQVLRSGTSIGANVEEATAAQSRKDFLSKMSIASKKARETVYWLRLYEATGLAKVDVRNELKEAKEIANILGAIVRTTSRSIAATRG